MCSGAAGRIDAVSLLHLDSAHVQKNEVAAPDGAAAAAAAAAHCCFCGAARFFWMVTHGDFFSRRRCEMFVSQGTSLAQVGKD